MTYLTGLAEAIYDHNPIAAWAYLNLSMSPKLGKLRVHLALLDDDDDD